MIIETKFNNGDVVYYADVSEAYTSTPCAECAGTGRLKIEGKTYTIACRDCNGRGSFSRSELAPAAALRTIGQIRVEIKDSPGKPGHSTFSNYGPQSGRDETYMCIETGVGSGSVFYAADLFHTEAEALDRAKVKLYEWRQRRDEEEARRQKEREQYAREFSEAEETDEPA